MTGTVLRIEHPESKKGCYTHFPFGNNGGGQELSQMISRHADSKHPNPFIDEGLNYYHITSNEFCGFANEKQLHNWFTDAELEMLYSLGFELVKVEVKNIRVGEYQVVFEKI